MSEQMRYLNASQTTLGVAVNNSVTSVTVTAAVLFPTEGDFFISIEAEVMRVTDVSGSVFTVVRGEEGTVAEAHPVDVLIQGPLCKATLQEYTEQHYYYEQETPAFTVTDPVTDLIGKVADFTWVNQGGATATDRNSNIFMQAPGDAGDQFRGLFMTAPSTPYEIIMGWTHVGACGGSGTSSPFPQSELVFRESSTGKMMSIVFMPRADTTETPQRVQVKRMDSNTSFETSTFFNPWQFGQGLIWCKIEDDGTNLKFHVGVNGIDFLEVFSQGRTAFLASGPNQVGFGTNPAGSSVYDITIDVAHFGKV